MKGTMMHQVKMRGMTMSNVYIEGADMSEADMSNVYLNNSNMIAITAIGMITDGAKVVNSNITDLNTLEKRIG